MTLKLRYIGVVIASGMTLLTLAACSPAATTAVETIAPTTSPASVEPTSTPTPTPVPAAEPGERANPLQVGQMLKVSPESMFTVGAAAPTEIQDGYVVLPLHVEMDWEVGRAQGLDPENDGLDASYSLTVSYVSASGQSYTMMDDYQVENQWFRVGVVYPPTTTIDAGVPISVPADQVAGGAWKVQNSKGDAVFIAGG